MTLPPTSCGLPFGGCALCNPEQRDLVDERKYWEERMKTTPKPSRHVGDFWPGCPPEWSKISAHKTAIAMAERYGSDAAARRVAVFRQQYLPGSWGRKHWDIVLSDLEDL